jgi:hypothetical protein
MSSNIIETIQTDLGYASLQKIDPNKQDANDNGRQAPAVKLAQAAIPVVLTGLYKFTRTDDGCRDVLTGPEIKDWLGEIFREKENEAIQKVAEYAGVSLGQAEHHMENIATDAIKTLRKAAGENAGPEKVKAYMNGQRHYILVYLPPSLNMGDLFHDDGLDDRTNKMEGPVSNFIHNIENKFSGGGKN